MGTIIKVISLVMACILVVGFLGSAIAIGANTVKYMSKQKFDFGEAIKWSFEDYRDWLNHIFDKNDENEPIEFGYTNRYVEVVACTDLWR